MAFMRLRTNNLSTNFRLVVVAVGILIIWIIIECLPSAKRNKNSTASTQSRLDSVRQPAQFVPSISTNHKPSDDSYSVREAVINIDSAVRTKDTALLRKSIGTIRSNFPLAVSDLVLLLNRGESDVKEIAGELLAEEGSNLAVEALITEYLRTDDDNTRSNLQTSILAVRSDQSINTFSKYFGPDSPGGVRRLSELVLAAQGSPAVVNALDSLYDSSDDIVVHRSIANVMRHIQNPLSDETLARKLDDKSQSVEKMEMYVDALLSINTPNARSRLKSLSEEQDAVRSRLGVEAMLQITANQK